MPHKFIQSIPQHAKRVFKGVLFEVWQWEQEMFDGTMRTFEAVKRPDYAGVIPILENGKVVLLEQQQPGSRIFFSFPGGRVDEGETPLEAAQRELREEAGLEAREWMTWKQFQPHAKYVFEVHIFIARQCYTIGVPTMPEEEKIVVHERNFDELLELADQEDLFRGDAMRIDFLRAKYNKEERERLRRLFYGST
ncbi:MAG: NUDIX hydrolase [Patescibacteria group bacterium]